MRRHHGGDVLQLAHLPAAPSRLVWSGACITTRLPRAPIPLNALSTIHATCVIGNASLLQHRPWSGGHTAMRAASSSFSSSPGSNECHTHSCYPRSQDAFVAPPSSSNDLRPVTSPTFTPSTTDADRSAQRFGETHDTESSGGGAPPSSPRVSTGAIGKSTHGPRSTRSLKVKRKAPWGAKQLRDSWSEDAMSKRNRESMDERIHREYRYHPDEFRRRYIRYTAILTFPCIALGMSVTYYYLTGRPIWTADPQHLLNLLRIMDTSPRSKLYAYRLEETERLPSHVLEYRKAHEGQRAYDERMFRLMNSAFERPSEDVLRRLEMEEELKKAESAAVGEVGMMKDSEEDE